MSRAETEAPAEEVSAWRAQAAHEATDALRVAPLRRELCGHANGSALAFSQQHVGSKHVQAIVRHTEALARPAGA